MVTNMTKYDQKYADKLQKDATERYGFESLNTPTEFLFVSPKLLIGVAALAIIAMSAISFINAHPGVVAFLFTH